MLCRERVAQLRAHDDALAGAAVRVIGSGTPAMAAAFAGEIGGGIAMYSDEDRASFRAAGARRGLGSVLSPRAFRNYWRAWRGGHRQTRIQGDPTQQGGVLVVSPDGELLYAELDAAGGDPIDWSAVAHVVAGRSS